MTALSSYEAERAANIERNKEILRSLGFKDQPLFAPKPKPKPKPSKEKKKKVAQPSQKRKPVTDDDDDTDEASAKKQRLEVSVPGDSDGPGPRRSQRNAGKVIDYNKENTEDPVVSVTLKKIAREYGSVGREGGKRTQDPKTYGSIPGIAVGTWWPTRMGCSADAVHAPWVAGISSGTKGAYSIALSGGYDDDIDWGNTFTYTGSGGRDLKGTKAAPKNLRTAPQSSDQTFENTFNKALQKSSETRKPIRVVRGYKLPSAYGPEEGYRYDGLYIVEKAWIAVGNNKGKYLVCKFAFRRLPGQPPIPLKPGYGAENDDGEEASADDEDDEDGSEGSGEEDGSENDDDDDQGSDADNDDEEEP